MRRVIKWHRYIGLVIGVFVINLAVTGLMLNHTDELGLSSRHTSSTLLRWLYGLPEPHVNVVFEAAGHEFIAAKDALLMDGKQLPQPEPSPVTGVVVLDGIVLMAGGDAISLLSEEGELIDKLQAPGKLETIGLSGQKAIVKTTTGLYIVDADYTQLQRADVSKAGPIHWSKPKALSHAERIERTRQLPLHGLPVERVVLDLHSGRLFGYAGVLLFDAIAILMIVLVLSGLGVWLWRRSKRARKR